MRDVEDGVEAAAATRVEPAVVSAPASVEICTASSADATVMAPNPLPSASSRLRPPPLALRLPLPSLGLR